MRSRGSLRTDLVIGSACLVLVMCFVVYAYMTRTSELQLRSTFETETESLGRAAASILGAVAATGGMDDLVRVAPQLLRLPDTERLAVIGAEGGILVSFPDSARILGAESITGGLVRLPSSIVVSETMPGVGTLLIERSVRRLHAQMTDAHAKALELCILLAVFGTLVAWVLTARVATPLRRLAVAVARVSEGDYQRIDLPRRNDEITTLAEKFNLMVDEIARKSGALEETNQELRNEILDRRMIACALEETQQRMQAVLANAPIVITAIDQQGIITMSEGRPVRKLPSRPSHVVSRHYSEIYPTNERILHNIKRALAGDSFTDEVVVDERTFEVHYSRGRDEQGKPAGVISVAVDITSRKRFEHERDQLQDRLAEAQKMEAVGNLAGGFAHSFNNLLVGILGHADLLRDVPPAQKSATAIHSAAERAATLAQQLLGFAGQGRFQSTRVDIHQTIENCLTLLAPTMMGSINNVREFDAENRFLVGDPAQIEQMLFNLIKNACEAMPEGGTLTLRTNNVEYERRASGSEIDASAREYIMISVIDTGVGIPGHLRDRVFEPFFSSKPAGLGTGMGLAMAHGIVESHGGTIRFTSRVDRGTEFNAILPCAVSAAGSGEGNTSMNEIEKSPQRILVIDDDEIVREMQKELLAALGYAPSCAESGFAAVEHFADYHDKIDLVILDMLMPGMDGCECFRRLQALDSTVPVLISSGYASNDSVQSLLDSGAVGFLKKPYTIRELSAAITAGIRPRQKAKYGSMPITIAARPLTLEPVV